MSSRSLNGFNLLQPRHTPFHDASELIRDLQLGFPGFDSCNSGQSPLVVSMIHIIHKQSEWSFDSSSSKIPSNPLVNGDFLQFAHICSAQPLGENLHLLHNGRVTTYSLLFTTVPVA
ncbi:hypothetical protein Tco_0356374 [Tanacetum coccineum]